MPLLVHVCSCGGPEVIRTVRCTEHVADLIMHDLAEVGQLVHDSAQDAVIELNPTCYVFARRSDAELRLIKAFEKLVKIQLTPRTVH